VAQVMVYCNQYTRLIVVLTGVQGDGDGVL